MKVPYQLLDQISDVIAVSSKDGFSIMAIRQDGRPISLKHTKRQPSRANLYPSVANEKGFGPGKYFNFQATPSKNTNGDNPIASYVITYRI